RRGRRLRRGHRRPRLGAQAHLRALPQGRGQPLERRGTGDLQSHRRGPRRHHRRRPHARRGRHLRVHRPRPPGPGAERVTKVLVVDDEPALLRAVGAALKARQYDVATATTGQGAIDAVALDAPDLIVLDLGLPDLDGIEVCRRVREWTDVPIVVLSAEGSEERKVLALDEGADDYVTKPFSTAELLARIRVALRHRRREAPSEDSMYEVGEIGRAHV